ncbi:sodium-dependent transporter [Azohydromonas sediminis]|uniref:sodium-dependent transporter n=1 Tax=Azohydromonas sediminis TaxID=2259674 RepID=UPI000E648220|nr:sodium-dependent transporter [Azohydromonas sediminis]
MTSAGGPTDEREHWRSGVGFVLATLGAAVGIGNVWRFSYVAGEHGGGAFLIVYVLFVAAVGLPLMLAEFALGHAAQRGPEAAFAAVAPRRAWRRAGLPGIAVATLILAYYAVIAGWTLKFFVVYLLGGTGLSDASVAFEAFLASPQPVAWQAAVMAACVAIVGAGVQRGIEAATTWLMPLLALVLVVLAGYSLSLPGARDGLAFVFAPDWNALARADVYLAAMGQAFFSLGLACGVMVTYGGYLPRGRALLRPAVAIVAGDTGFAVVAGVMVFPAVFSFGLDPAAGPALAFVTMPQVFAQMPFGRVFGAAFFGLLAVAALTSAISLLEVVVAFVVDRGRTRRPRAALAAGAAIFVLGLPAALSFGWLGGVRIAGLGVLDAMDFVASNVLMPLNGLLIAAFVGWVWSAHEARRASTLRAPWAGAWHAVLRYGAPGVIALVLLRALGVVGA